MALKKGFLRDPEIRINKYLIFSGILWSLMISIILYFFFTYFQEAFRVFPFDSKKNLLVLTPYEINFYNLFYASLASIIGQNFGQRLILQNLRPIRNSKTRLSQKIIINSTEFTLWTTFYWVVKTFSLLGILYWTFVLHYDIDFIQEFTMFFLLLPGVWFLNSQLGLYRVLKRITFKWMGYALLLFLTSTIALSRFNIWEHEAVNHKILSETLEYNYHLSLPTSQILNRTQQYRQSIKLSIVRTKSSAEEIRLFVESRRIPLHEIDITDLKPIIQKENNRKWPGYNFVIAADSQIKLNEVLEVEESLRNLNVKRVSYQVTPSNSRYPQIYPSFSDLSQAKLIGYSCQEAKEIVDSLRNLGYKAHQIEWPPEHFCYYVTDILKDNRILVEMTNSGLKMNNKQTDETTIKRVLKKLFKKYESEFTVLFKPNPNVSFGEYIKARDVLFQAVVELRKEYALNTYNFEYDYTYDNRYEHNDEVKEIRWKYPMSFFELTGWNLELYEYLKSK